MKYLLNTETGVVWGWTEQLASNAHMVPYTKRGGVPKGGEDVTPMKANTGLKPPSKTVEEETKDEAEPESEETPEAEETAKEESAEDIEAKKFLAEFSHLNRNQFTKFLGSNEDRLKEASANVKEAVVAKWDKIVRPHSNSDFPFPLEG